MHLRHRIAATFAACVALVLVAGAASAQVALDPVDIAVGSAGHGKVRLTLTAGASGAPGGFEVCYMPLTEFIAAGSRWPDAGWLPGEGWVDYTGTGTLHTWGSTTIDFTLDPNQSADIEIGSAYDESGVSGTTTEELVSATEYVFTVYALPGATAAKSSLSSNKQCSTTSQGSGCTYTQGYWKTHTNPGDWPVTSLTLGTVTYSQAQLIAILDQPVAGNGLVSLARQLIAAKLNIAAGASASGVSGTIAAADAAIGGLVVPSVGSGSLAPGGTSAWTQTLDDYDNGYGGVPHCGTTPVHSTSWGGMKSLYR